MLADIITDCIIYFLWVRDKQKSAKNSQKPWPDLGVESIVRKFLRLHGPEYRDIDQKQHYF